MPLQTVESQRLYRQIAEQLRALIAGGEFTPGGRLPAERDLARQLGVSRPSVREALIALEVEGVIDVRTGSGIYVRPAQAQHKAAAKARESELAEWGPLELMRARELVEGEIAALAARNAKRTDIAALSAAMEQMREEAGAGVIPRGGDEAFHTAVARACRNEVLSDTVRGYWQARSSPMFERLGEHFENPASWKAALAEHTAVFEAIRGHDAAGARGAMQAHLKKAYSRYNASWRRANHS
jgi:DNA-binding FadR family transcriptional regulator